MRGSTSSSQTATSASCGGCIVTVALQTEMICHMQAKNESIYHVTFQLAVDLWILIMFDIFSIMSDIEESVTASQLSASHLVSDHNQ